MIDKYNCPINSEYLRKYILGGKCIFTLYSAKTQLRYTFRIKKSSESERYCIKKSPIGFGYYVGKESNEWYCIERLFGENNTKDYRYIGCWNSLSHISKADKYISSREAWAQIVFFLSVVFDDKPWPQTMYFYPSGRCARCGRLLTTPESIEIGFGPHCRGRE